MISSINDYLYRESKLSVWRAPTDNDRHIKKRWGYIDGDNLMGENYNVLCNKIYDCMISDKTISFTGSLSGISRIPFFRYTLEYSLLENKKLMVNLKGDILDECEFLPRLGFEFFINDKNPQFEYFGMGPMENYIDMCSHTMIGRYKSDADSEYVSYAMPQEHGNHTKTKYLSLNSGLFFKAYDYFEFNVSKYTIEQLDVAKHTDELNENNFSVVRIDYKNSGIGSGSCGPQLIDKYKLNDKKIDFTFYIGV
jgi:beta-galactosidase